MADDGILGLLGRLNDPNALYQGALSDPATQQAMAGRGLLAMAGSFADSAMPTRMPTPIGAVLGHAAGALGTSQDALMGARLQAAQAQLAGSTVGLQNILGPAYLAQIEEARRIAAGGAPGGGPGIPSPPAPGVPAPAAIAGTGGGGPNNPGNIKTTGGGWQAFPTPEAGIAAIGDWGVRAQANHKLTTVRQLIDDREHGYAPSADPGNRGKNLPEAAAREMGVGPDDPIDLSDPHMRTLWTQAILKQEGAVRLAVANPRTGADTAPLPPPAAGQTAAAPPPPPGAAVSGLLKLPDFTGQMNAPIPGIAPAAPAAPGSAAAARPPRSAGEALVAMNQATRAAGGPPPLPPGLVQMADASGQVPIPSGPPPGPPAPNLVPGGASMLPPGLLGGGGAAPGPPPQVAAGPPPPLVTPPGPPAPAPPITQPQAPPPAPAAPMGGPPAGAPPPLNLPLPPTMPGGAMGPPVQPTPQQMIAQGIVGISALIGKPAPEYMQKLAGQPLEMQMEAYKAYVGAQANQMTEKYKKEIEVASAGTLEWLRTQAGIPAQKELQTHEQDLHLRNEMATRGFLMGPSGKYDQINPAWLDMKAREAGATAGATAAATNAANLGTTYPMGGGPPTATPPGAVPPGAAPANEPAKGTTSPYGMLPPLSEQNLPRSKTEADAAIPLWNNRVDAWTAAIGPAQVAEQRMLTIADAFKSIQTGRWLEQKANILAALEGIGIHVDPDKTVAQVQMVLHENVLSTLPMLKAATRNPTQTEYTTTREVREGPNIQPEANLQMLAEDIAMMRQTQNLPAAFHASGWQNALQFESAFLGRNKLAPMVKDIKDEIGQLRGMQGWVPPPGSVTIGHDPMTKDTIELKNNQWIWTSGPNSGKPYVPPAAGGR